MRKLSLIVGLAMLAFSPACMKERLEPAEESIAVSKNAPVYQGRVACGSEVTANLDNNAGTVVISNDETNVYVTVTSTSPTLKLQTIKLAYGTTAHMINEISYS